MLNFQTSINSKLSYGKEKKNKLWDGVTWLSSAVACGKQYPYEVWQQIKGSHFSCFSDYIAL